jgi:hypothetical protein
MSITRHHSNQRMSQIVIHGDTVYLAGQVADDASADITVQTRQVLQKIEKLLGEAGSDQRRSGSRYLFHLDETGRCISRDFDRGHLGYGIRRRQGGNVTFLANIVDGAEILADGLLPDLVLPPSPWPVQAIILDFSDQRRAAVQPDIQRWCNSKCPSACCWPGWCWATGFR